ncbi:MAG: acetyl-CoA C-acetyltransferase [Deltaproteobacteria bacterium]|nr:MAG: acetyl-CoA C-acetyltransferase [Deltaproteobacteria bacterium]
MREVVITSAVRTPIGSFQGALSTVPAPKLGAICIAEAVKRSGIEKEDVDQVIMGNVLPAGVGQAPARQAMIYAGIPTKAGALTINKVCGSGLKAVMLAAQSIMTDESDIVVAGGMENMSLAPYLLDKARTGYRLGNATIYDHMVMDGLWDVYNDIHMGNCAEILARDHKITREDQDEYALSSYERARKAIENGDFEKEIVPVEVPQRKGDPLVVTVDEEPGRVDLSKLPTLKPAFQKDGTVTAGNSSKINDGASALVVMGADVAEKRGIKPMAKIVGFSTASLDPVWFTIAPIEACRKLLEKLGLSVDDIDLWEINEAFAGVAIAAIRGLGLDRDRVNVNGGAVALGHPIGASGARILTTLLHAMEARDARRGIASLCIGGGEAVALCVERV